LALTGLGSVDLVRGDLAAAEGRYREVLDRARAGGLPWELAGAAFNLANTLRYLGRTGEAATLCAEALARYRSLGERQGVARAELLLAGLALDRGEFARARASAEEILAAGRELGDWVAIREALARLALVGYAGGDDDQALACCRESLAFGRGTYFAPDTDAALVIAAGVFARQGQPAVSARLLGAAAAWRDRFGGPDEPGLASIRSQASAASRTALGEDAFAAAWAVGRVLSPEQAMAECRGSGEATTR
jgi:tetratricopeptide (TPR) repeat protein